MDIRAKIPGDAFGLRRNKYHTGIFICVANYSRRMVDNVSSLYTTFRARGLSGVNGGTTWMSDSRPAPLSATYSCPCENTLCGR